MMWACLVFLAAYVLGLTRVAEDGEGFAAIVLTCMLFKYIQLNFLIPGANAWYNLLGWQFLQSIYRLKGLFPFPPALPC